MTVKTQRKAIQAEIKTQLELVSGVENVYEDDRNPQDVQAWLEQFVNSAETRVQTWRIRRNRSLALTSEAPRGQFVPRGSETWYQHQFEVDLFYGWREGLTETEFQDLIDDVLDQFKNKRSLGAWSATAPLMLNRTQMGVLGDMYGHQAFFGVEVIAQETGLVPV